MAARANVNTVHDTRERQKTHLSSRLVGLFLARIFSQRTMDECSRIHFTPSSSHNLSQIANYKACTEAKNVFLFLTQLATHIHTTTQLERAALSRGRVTSPRTEPRLSSGRCCIQSKRFSQKMYSTFFRVIQLQ